jgi:hypothetical protein
MWPCRFALRSVVLLLAVLCLLAILASGSDQPRTEKQISKITAMATGDSTARTIVSATMADLLGVDRKQLVRERRAMNLSYGSLFVAHQLSAAGTKMLDIALELQTGKNIFQIAQARNADWRALGDAAKKLNDRIEENIYKHFLHAAADKARALAENYDPDLDVVKSDREVSPEETARTREVYVFWRDRAARLSGKGLDSTSEAVLGKSADIYKGPDRPHQ